MRVSYFLLVLFLSFFSVLSSFSQTSDFSDTDAQLSLSADSLIYDYDNSRVIARGNVRLSYRGRVVRASEVTYDQSSRRVQAIGSIELLDSDGSIVFADTLDLTDDFASGFIRSLRVETKDKTYFSAERAEHDDGSTIFYDGIYTACERCPDSPDRPVTWQIKASKIIVDGEERSVSYSNARLELLGIPVVYIPYFRHGDTSIRRKSGFLPPTIQFTDDFGTLYRQSYFLALSDSSDMKASLSSYSKQGFLGQWDYRRRFVDGYMTLTFAGIDQQQPDNFSSSPDTDVDSRFMMGSYGDFKLTDRWKTGWNILAQTDDSFANTYSISEDYSDINFTNEVYLEGLGTHSSFSVSGYYYDVQGSDYQIEDEQAFVHPVVDYHYTTGMPRLGGDITLNMNLTSLSRQDLSDSTSNTAFPAGSIHGIEGDNHRFSADIDWRRSLIFSGFSFTPSLGIYGDSVYINNDINDPTIYNLSESYQGRFVPRASLEIGYPLLMTAGSSTHILEPLSQVILRPNLSPMSVPFPNEDSQSLVFDTTNLFSHDKFSGYDRVESGTRMNYGIRYSGVFADGLNLTGLLGQSYHIGSSNPYGLRDLSNAGLDSGLDRSRTDYVASFGAIFSDVNSDYLSPSIYLQGRFDREDWSARRMESTFQVGTISWDVSMHYAYIDSQPLSGFSESREQFDLGGRFGLGGNWRLFGNTNYDIENASVIGTRYGIGYDDSCLSFSVVFSRTRDIYSATQNDSSIGFKFSIGALGALGDDANLLRN